MRALTVGGKPVKTKVYVTADPESTPISTFLYPFTRYKNEWNCDVTPNITSSALRESRLTWAPIVATRNANSVSHTTSRSRFCTTLSTTYTIFVRHSRWTFVA